MGGYFVIVVLMEVGYFGDVFLIGIDLRLVICGKCEVLFCVVLLGKS